MEDVPEDYTQCFICCNNYDETVNIPKFLNCHHFYCITCIRKIAASTLDNQNIICPGCRTSSSMNSLVTNNAVLSYAKFVTKYNNAMLKVISQDMCIKRQIERISELEKAQKSQRDQLMSDIMKKQNTIKTLQARISELRNN